MKSYAERICQCTEEEFPEILLEGAQFYTNCLMRAINGKPCEDLPIIVAAVKILSREMEKGLDDDGRNIAEKMVQIFRSATVNMDELVRQAKEEAKNDG